MTREDAWNLLTEYNQEEFHLQHGQIVEKTMMCFADKLGYSDEKEFWGIVGLLHDLKLKSVKKKFKAKGFAAGCDREVIRRGAEMLGWTLDELIQQTIDALKTFAML